jgi:hypothetical protein
MIDDVDESSVALFMFALFMFALLVFVSAHVCFCLLYVLTVLTSSASVPLYRLLSVPSLIPLLERAKSAVFG